MTIKRIDAGKRMSQAVVHNGTVYLAGQVALDAPGKSVAEQTAAILARIDRLLAEAGTDKTKLHSAHLWLVDIKAVDDMNKVWDAWVAPGCAPARATVESKLAAPQFLVEIAITAAA
jgi:enamine deaminase RidA (YjgF/YER057c/UK114 family)